jgi:hypothetical protein
VTLTAAQKQRLEGVVRKAGPLGNAGSTFGQDVRKCWVLTVWRKTKAGPLAEISFAVSRPSEIDIALTAFESALQEQV